MNKNIILYADKSKCCGCGACANICSKGAITMKTDEYGFVYPEINDEKCVGCGACKKICAYQSENSEKSVTSAFVAAAKDEQILKQSASGGVFSSVAVEFLKNGGIVYGCSLEHRDGTLFPEHIRIESIDDLHKLQGSKYVQSNMESIFKKVCEDLKSGREVLFSGTPCQVDSLKKFTAGTDRSRLFTIDLICHGTPSRKFFQDYLAFFEKKHKCKVVAFLFRDKTYGWGHMMGRITYVNKNGKTKCKPVYQSLSAYYKLFLNSTVYRDCCYSCKYANMQRVGDLTIGDFWGIKKAHPNVLSSNGGDFDENKGISCILVNSQKGQILLDKCGISLKKYQSSPQNVMAENGQLKHPSKKPESRSQVLELYRTGGFESVDSWFNKKLGIKRYISPMRAVLRRFKKRYLSR